MAARAEAQQAFLDGGDELAAELVSGDAALTAATEADGVWSLNAGDANVGLVLDATAPTYAWGDATLAGWERPEVAEWVTTARNGIEHAMLVEAPLTPGNEQRLTVLTAGLQPILFNSSNILLNDNNGLPVIAYGNLFAFDANAQEVPTWFEVVGSDIAIAFDDTDATYPILIDPLATAASTTLGGVAHQVTPPTTNPPAQGAFGRGMFGWSVASGDIDGNGYDDVVVSAPEACGPGCQEDEGIVEVFLGTTNGLPTTATFTLQSNVTGAEMGRSLAVGDIDGDGCDDIVAGAPGGEIGDTDEGLVVVFFSMFCWGFDTFTSGMVLESDEGFTKMGTSVAVAKTSGSGALVSHIYATGEDSRALWEFKFDDDTLTFNRSMRTFGTTSAPLIPSVVVAVKDIDRDGDDEIAVSFPEAFSPASTLPQRPEVHGWVSVFRGIGGPFGGINTTSLTVSCPFSPTASPIRFPDCGRSLASADVNGDGRGDLIVSNRNVALPGPPNGGISPRTTNIWTATASGSFTNAPQASIEVPNASRTDGLAVAGLGDLNLDGYDEFASCSALDGACRVYGGSPNGTYVQRGICTGLANQAQHGMIAGGITRKDPSIAGNSGDVIVGAAFAGSTEGNVRIFSGTPAGPQLTVSTSQTSVKGSLVNQKVGRRVLLADLNNDGRDDLISGAPDAPNGSLTEAGRVDVWVANSAGNFQANPSWTINGTTTGERLGDALAVLSESDSTTKRLAIGAPGACTASSGPTCTCPACGAVQVHTWPGIVPDIVVDNYIARPVGLPGERFGSSLANIGNAYSTGSVDAVAVSTRTVEASVVLHRYDPVAAAFVEEDILADLCVGGSFQQEPTFALAGVDMNNDGITDVIVGDATCNSANGVDGLVVGFAGGGTSTDPMFELTGGGKSAFGYALAPAGDVDRDGRPDLLVGAPTEINGSVALGAVRIYRGTTSTPALLHIVRGTVSGSRFGESVAGGRDVNFDGFVDFIVGVPNISTSGGNAIVWRGTATTPKLLIGCSEVPAAGLGLAVAMGDVNNDDYDDIACGAPTINTTPAGAGVLVVYRGMW